MSTSTTAAPARMRVDQPPGPLLAQLRTSEVKAYVTSSELENSEPGAAR